MKYWLVGAGGIGCGVAGRLAETSDVTIFDTWDEHIAAINSNGLTVEYVGDRVVQVRPPALKWTEMSAVPSPPDVVLLAVKSNETRRMCEAMRPYLGPHSFVVSLQNCLNEPIIAEVLGEEATIGAICLFGGAMLGPGRARSNFNTSLGKLVIGRLDGSVTEDLEHIRNGLVASCPVGITSNIWGELWSKLTRNSMFNAVSASTGLTMAEWSADDTCLTLALGLGAETIRVALAQGIDLIVDDLYGHQPPEFLAPVSSATFASVAATFRQRLAKGAQPSMLQDILKGRPTEVVFMNGEVAREGSRLGIRTPLHSNIVELVESISRGARAPSRAVIEELFKPWTDKFLP